VDRKEARERGQEERTPTILYRYCSGSRTEVRAAGRGGAEMKIGQAELAGLMDGWCMGSPSPFYKRKDRLRSGEPIAVATFVGERVHWIGKVDTDMFSTRGKTDFGVYVGITPYRVIFYRAASVFSDLCRSYWFEVDVEGRTWQRGRVRKNEYSAVGLARPRFKKGLIGRQIVVAGCWTRVTGREETVFEHELSGLEWMNPMTGKFEGGKGQALYDQLAEAYENRSPISVGDLWLMDKDTHRAIVTTPGAVVEARDMAAAPVTAESVEGALVRKDVAPVIEEEGEDCPQCGHQLRAGAVFCGKCGHRLEEAPLEDEAVKTEEVVREAESELCPECSQPVRPGVQFCGKCGCPLVGEEESSEVKAEEPVAVEAVGSEASAEGASGEECPQCGKPQEQGWQVCPYCGGGLIAPCRECGKPIERGWVVCPYCATALDNR